MRLADLAGARAFASPLLDEPTVLGKLDDAVVPAVAMAVGDEDVARGRRHDNIGRLIEEIRSRPGNTGLPERQQHLTLRVELEDLMPLAVLPARVGHPEVAVPIDGGAVRKDEHPLTPRLEQPPAGVVLQNR